jgi:uncharacterized glyoxalase superfamily protein PhnB
MKLDAIGIVSADLAASVAFFRLLGVEFAGEPGADHLEARTPSGVRIMLDAEDLIRKLVPGWTRQVGNALVLAFDCGSPAAVDATYNAIVAAGHRGKTPPWDAFWGQRYACVLDPDGNQLDLFAAAG